MPSNTDIQMQIHLVQNYLVVVQVGETLVVGCVHHTVEVLCVDDSGLLLGFQVQDGQVVVFWVVVVPSDHDGHVVGCVIGLVGRGVSSTASLWVVSVGGCGVTGSCGRWHPVEALVLKRPRRK